MSFQTEMEARFGSQLLIRYTNPDSKSASTVNTTILAASLVFAQGRFKTYAGVAYDDTDDRMIDTSCDFAIYKLAGRFAERGEYQKQNDAGIQYLKDFRKVTNANRLNPQLVDRDLSVNNALNKTMDRLGISRIRENNWRDRI